MSAKVIKLRRKPTTIDITPTWRGILRVHLAVLERGTEKGRSVAVEELMRMAEAADSFNALVDQLRDNPDATGRGLLAWIRQQRRGK